MTSEKLPVRGKYYEGVILPDADPKKIGRYLVHIPELQIGDPDRFSNGIWCINTVTNSFIRYTDTSLRDKNSQNSYGYYSPLKPGTRVLVKFLEFDYNSGIIVDTISYEPPPNEDRDNLYLLAATDKSTWVHVDESNEKLAISFHKGRSNYVCQEDKIHIYKDTKVTFEVSDDAIHMYHPSGTFVTVTDNRIEFSVNNESTYVVMTGDSIQMKASGDIILEAGGKIALTGSTVESQSTDTVSETPNHLDDISQTSREYINDFNDKDEQLHNFFED